jgi:hypothetical protein
MPSLVSFAYLPNEERLYRADGKIQSVDYANPKHRYADPLLTLPKKWKDLYDYTSQGQLKGWYRTRKTGSSDRFTYAGHRVLTTDKLNRPLKSCGVAPSTWTDSSGRIWSISADKNLWRTVLVNTQKIYPTMTVMSESWYESSSTNGKVLIVLFRVKNSTGAAINWSPAFYHTNYGGWGECSSATINGASTWDNCGNCYAGSCTSQPTFSVPANRTSSIMFAITNSPSSSMRTQLLTFYGDTLKLPAGLEYVDDLDTAAGDWSQ